MYSLLIDRNFSCPARSHSCSFCSFFFVIFRLKSTPTVARTSLSKVLKQYRLRTLVLPTPESPSTHILMMSSLPAYIL